MPSIITNALKRFNARNFEESFSETSPDKLYVFLGQSTTPWVDENVADTPLDSPKEKLSTYDEIIGIKRVSAVDIIPVIKRINWTINTIYDEYDDEVEIVGGIDSGTGQPYQYYVMNSNFEIYKCISNNNGVASTVEPTGTGVNSFSTADGYIWKYMLTVNTTFAINYLNDTYIPLRNLTSNDGSAQWLVQSTATDGSIEHIIVTAGGASYDPNDPPLITITGDGTGATAVPTINVSTGVIEKITMTNIGSGYTYATIAVDNTGVPGSGATARAVVSPVGGHGFNPQKELNAVYRMIVTSFDGDEGGNVPFNVDYRKIGMLLNPFRETTGVHLALSGITGFFDEGETITGGTSGATATVVKYEQDTDEVYVTILTGAFTAAETITSTNGSATVDTITTGVNIPAIDQYIAPADLLKGSGDILYVNNRTKVTRFAEQEERVKLVITF